MKTSLFAAGIGTAIAFAAFAPNAVAQDNTITGTCQAVGANGAPEPLGDRDGHGISVGQISCHIDSGPLKDGIATGTYIWEWDGQTPLWFRNTASFGSREPLWCMWRRKENSR